MESVLRSWGNSQGVYIPKEFMRQLDISVNDKIIMKVENEKIVITKDNSSKMKEDALKSLRSFRKEKSDSKDYGKMYEEYLDERYGH